MNIPAGGTPMKSLLIALILLSLGGCSSTPGDYGARSVSAPNTDPKESTKTLDGFIDSEKAAKLADPATPSDSDRKIIRTADVTLEVKSTNDAMARLMSIAEARGGFVVTSEAKQRENVDPALRTMDVKLIIRIPANQFGPTLDEMKSLATNVTADNRTGQDVTEEFIDLEARLRTKKALELQFLEIMKQANKVSDALEVQSQIAEVRTEIEQLEGRKRFIENRAALATVTVNLTTPTPISVSPTGFGRNLREAVADALDLANGMLLFAVRFVIVMIPITLFVILPLWLLFRYLMRRAKRMRMARDLATPVPEPST
jgi:hypothetical protein